MAEEKLFDNIDEQMKNKGIFSISVHRNWRLNNIECAKNANEKKLLNFLNLLNNFVPTKPSMNNDTKFKNSFHTKPFSTK